MNDLKVCLLNDSFPPIIDGVSNAVVNYARIIEERYGHSIVVAPSVPGADDSIFNFPVLRYPSLDTRKLMGYVTGYPFSPEVTYRVKEEGSQILHLHCPATSALLARQLKESLDLPLIMTYHTKYDIDIARLIHNDLIQEKVIQALVQNISACDEVWTVSKGAGENLRSLGFEGNYHVMENGVDLPKGKVPDETIHKATAGYDIPDNVPLFLFVGRIMWYKGLRIILDALKSLKEQGQPFRMVFIGDGSDLSDVQSYAEKFRLDRQCFFTGALTDRESLRAWYSRADLFLFPSTFDTNGLVVREAAACALATVMIAGSCAAEGVTDGRNGFLIDESADAMSAKLMELCASPERIKEVGECAADELYISWEDAVGRAAERYGIILENYRCGAYPRSPSLQSSLLKFEGNRMQTLGAIGAVLHFRKEDDLLSKEKLQNAKAHAADLIKPPFSTIWQYLDRYL